jgi:hypothetical protein
MERGALHCSQVVTKTHVIVAAIFLQNVMKGDSAADTLG